MVDDEDIAAVHPALGGLPEAVVVKLALFPEAVAMLGADPFPDRRVGRGRQIGERSIRGLMRPLLDGPERFELPGLIEKHPLPAAPAPNVFGKDSFRGL